LPVEVEGGREGRRKGQGEKTAAAKWSIIPPATGRQILRVVC
jgi:hypothetical protein